MKKIKIVYEDNYLIIVDKPAGVLSISTDREQIRTMFHEVREYEKKKNKRNKIFIVHRLDKDTSGLMMFAKNEMIKNYLQNNWNTIKREYIAVVVGNVNKEKGEIRSYLKETKTLLTYSTNDQNGKFAITKYEKMKSNGLYSLLKITILTGRKNQIRVHMKEISHPIIGDKKYGNKINPIHRLALCANRLEFIHPVTKENLKIELSVPKEFLQLFE